MLSKPRRVYFRNWKAATKTRKAGRKRNTGREKAGPREDEGAFQSMTAQVSSGRKRSSHNCWLEKPVGIVAE